MSDSVYIYLLGGSQDNERGQTMTALQAARQALGAIRIGSAYAYYDDATGRYWMVTGDELRHYMDYRRDPATHNDAYSHWCAATCAVEMPADYEPPVQQ